MAFSTESKVSELLGDEKSKAVIERHLPGFSANPQVSMAMGMALSSVAKFSNGQISDEILQNIDSELREI